MKHLKSIALAATLGLCLSMAPKAEAKTSAKKVFKNVVGATAVLVALCNVPYAINFMTRKPLKETRFDFDKLKNGTTKEKTPKMRYLAIFQIKSKSGDSVCKEVIFDEQTRVFSAGGWSIKAELDASKPAKVEVCDSQGTASFASTGSLEFDGKEYRGKATGSAKLIEIIDGEKVIREAVDEVPAAIRKVMRK